MIPLFYNPTFLLISLPALLLALWAQWRVKCAFNKVSQVRTMSGLRGAAP